MTMYTIGRSLTGYSLKENRVRGTGSGCRWLVDTNAQDGVDEEMRLVNTRVADPNCVVRLNKSKRRNEL